MRGINVRFRVTISILTVCVVVLVLYSGVLTAYFITQLNQQKEENWRQNIKILANRRLIPAYGKFLNILKELSEQAKEKMKVEEIVSVANIISTYCVVYENIGLTPDKVFAVMEQESNFDPSAISNKDAYGLMQCIRATFEIHLPDMGYKTFTVELALNPVINAEVGIRELVRLRSYWLAEGYDNWMVTITSYYWGIRWTKRKFLDKGTEESEYGNDVLDKAQRWEEDIG